MYPEFPISFDPPTIPELSFYSSKMSQKASKENIPLSRKVYSNPSTPNSSPSRRKLSTTNVYQSPDNSPNSTPRKICCSVLKVVASQKYWVNDEIKNNFDNMNSLMTANSVTPIEDLRQKFYLQTKELSRDTTVDRIGEIESSNLVNEFWGFDIDEALNASECLSEIKNDDLEIVASSLVFLSEHAISNKKRLFQSLSICYRELSKRNRENSQHHYHSAKYMSLAENYSEAWHHLSQCKALLNLEDKEEMEWINLLTKGYFLKIQEMKNASTQARCCLQIAEFVHKVNKDEAIDYFLQSALRFYQNNQDFTQIQSWDTHILFSMAYKAYSAAQEERDETVKGRLLCISRDCFVWLSNQNKLSDYDCNPLIDTILKSDKNYRSRNLASIFVILGNIAWNEEKKDEAVYLYFKAAVITHSYNPIDYNKENWNPEIVIALIDFIINENILNPDKMVKGFFLFLTRKKIVTDIYLSVFNYFRDNKKWVTANKLIHSEFKLRSSSDQVLQSLKEEIDLSFAEVQKQKKEELSTLLAKIDKNKRSNIESSLNLIEKEELELQEYSDKINDLIKTLH